MSTYTTSTFPNTEKYSFGFLAFCRIGVTFNLNAATLSKKSLATLFACSTAKTIPLGPTISEIWLTVVPVDAPKYNTLDLFSKGK